MTKMTEADGARAIDLALALGLEGADFVRDLGAAKVAAACNGIGPDWFPAAVRDEISEKLHMFIPAADVHDCRYSYDNDGTKERFHAANEELRRNCLRIANLTYAWWSPYRYLTRHAGHILADACEAYGWKAFEEAYTKKRGEDK